MTELLFHTDSYVREFDARVVAVDGERVAFDRTAFYPTGGGQPCDRGWLFVGAESRAAVCEVRRDGSLVWHTAPGHQLAVGDAVHGSLDWERRYALMRTHTALHVLSAVIWREYGSQVTGGNMEPLRARMDFELVSMHADFVQAVSAAVEEELRANRPIEVRSVSRAEAERIPDLIRTKINLLPADITAVRTVNIVGLDWQADGGTHVARTGEVGVVRVADYHSKGKANKRIVIEIGDR